MSSRKDLTSADWSDLTAGQRKQLLIDNSEYRKCVWRELCQHCRDGYSLNSFWGMCEHTIKRYSKSHADDCSIEELDAALREGQRHWEMLGAKQAAGLSMGNASAWKFGMSAKYGWSDKVEMTNKHQGNLTVEVVSYAKAGSVHDSSATQEPDQL